MRLLVRYHGDSITDCTPRLPELRQKVDDTLAASTAELKKLPAQLSLDPSSELLSMIGSFSGDAKAYVDGTQTRVALVQDNRGIYRQFKIAIRKTAPEYRPYLRREGTATLATWDDSEVIDEEPLPASEKALPDSIIYLDDLREHIRK